LEHEAEQAQELVQQCRKRRRELAEESRSLQRSIKALEVKLPKLRMEIDGFDTSRRELGKLIPDLRSKCELSTEDKAKLKELQKKIHSCKTDMSSCEKQARKLESEVTTLQKSILDAGGSKLKSQQAACSKILSALNDAEKALNSAKVAITTSKKAAAKAKQQIEDAEQQTTESIDALEKKESELEGLEEKAAKVSEAFETVKEFEAEKREALELARKEVEELKKTHANARCLEIELAGQVEEFDRLLAESKSKKKHWQKELGKLVKAEEADDEFDFSDDEEAGEVREEEVNKSTARESAEDEEMASDEGESADKRNTAKEDEDPKSGSSLPVYSFSALEKYDVKEIKGDIELLESERNDLAKNTNMGAIEEYRRKEADYLAR
jgi:structural maintenance of chromosome 4